MANFGSPWLKRFKRNPDASVRLFCFHCAGGSASEFQRWPTHLSGNVELVAVQLPGREERITEPFIANMDSLIDRVVEALTPFLDKPYVIFGHSLGALAGFEAIRELRRRRLNEPFLFIPAGRRAAQVQNTKPPIASLPMESFIEELRKDYGVHIGHVLQSADLREAFIPQIHADFALSETYVFRAEQPLSCPIVAFAGVKEDDLGEDELSMWSEHTNKTFYYRRFPGDHFFIRESQELVIEAIQKEISAVRSVRLDESCVLS